MTDGNRAPTPVVTAGLDLGDKYSYLCLIDQQSAEVMEEGRLRTTTQAFLRRFDSEQQMTVAIEAGTHSPWVSRKLEECGHKVLVANPRKTRLIYGQGRKTDKLDAEKLARLARVDPKLLSPLEHRREASQAHLALIRSREVVVRSRAQLINHVRGTVKSFGARLPKCSTASFHKKVAACIPEELRPALEPLIETIASLSTRVRHYDCELEQLAQEHYPESKLLRQVQGLGTLTALTFVLTLEDPGRFEESRSVGAYLGLVPSKDQSGERDPQKRISREGDEMLRRLLVGSAHYILGPFGEDCDLRRQGLKIAGGAAKNARKRAVVAVARKLSVLLHHLWISSEVYEPLYNSRQLKDRAA
jgi:transposase